jgi:hypothetical protein
MRIPEVWHLRRRYPAGAAPEVPVGQFTNASMAARIGGSSIGKRAWSGSICLCKVWLAPGFNLSFSRSLVLQSIPQVASLDELLKLGKDFRMLNGKMPDDAGVFQELT